MKRAISIILLTLTIAFAVRAQAATDAAELTQLLNEFLAGASRNDAAIHDRFWADELVYTGSGGRRRSKADVMKDVRSAPAPKTGEPTTNYSAEDIRVQQYGNTAIVAFRLVGATVRNGSAQVANFFNTGTLIKREGKWQVVAWQATRIPRDLKDDEKEVAKVELAFHHAMLASDAKSLESLVDESFIWTHRTGEQMSRKQLLDQIGSGQLKYAKLETRDVKVNVYGDSAVVRGVSPRQRTNGELFIAPYTLTFINEGGGWKAVAFHTSRPPDPAPTPQISKPQEAAMRQIISSSGQAQPVNVVFSGNEPEMRSAAEQLAKETGRKLYRVDLNEVVSKYIGETEKNLNRIFANAKANEVVLFFDEADALFGKRSHVSSAHDRYANVEVSYLLQRMETFRGISILALNSDDELTRKFLRRFRFTLTFPNGKESQ